MRAVIFAAVLLIVASIVIPLRASKFRGSEVTQPSRIPSNGLLAFVALIAVAFAVSQVVLNRFFICDDAYVSYRYANTLAFGHGLAWNAGDPPIEGFRSLFVVLALAPFARAGVDPLLVTRALGAGAAVAVAFLLFVRHREQYGARTAALLSCAYVISNLAFSVIMAGLETLFLTLAVYVAYHFASDYFATRRFRALRAAGAALLVAALVRPEAAFLAALVSAIGAPRDVKEGRWRQHGFTMGALFWVPFALLIGVKRAYFGMALPGSSAGLIAALGGNATRVLDFLVLEWKLVLLALVAIPLVERARLPARLLAASFCLSFVGFYLHAEASPGTEHHFAFPLAPLLMELALPAVAAGVAACLRFEPRFLSEALLLVCLALALAPDAAGWTRVWRAAHRDYDFAPFPHHDERGGGHFRHLLEAGRALGAYPRMRDLTLASADPGVLPFASGVRHVDLSGSNDAVLAHERDVTDAARYVFGRRPDVFVQREHADGSLLTDGPGVLGDHARWAEHGGWDDYDYVGSVVDVKPWRDELNVFVRKGAPPDVAAFLRRQVVDYVRGEAPVYGSARTARRKRAGSVPIAARLDPADRARLPVAIAENRGHLVDARGAPFLVRGDAAWSSAHELDREAFLAYLGDRKQRGFNAFLVNVADHTSGAAGYPNAYKEPPFLAPGDFGTPNERYFAHLDWLLRESQAAGFLVFLCPAYLGYQGGDEGWYTNLLRNGPSKLRQYGRFVGQRWRDLDNIVWVEGGDFTPPPEGMALVNAVAAGIKETDDRHLHTAHFGPETSAGDVDPAFLDIDNTYTYRPVYLKVARDHAAVRGRRPLLLIESLYENEHQTTPELIRAEAYHGLLNGASGNFFGSFPIWNFGKGWRETLDGPGSRSMTHLFALFEGLPWWTLEPEPPNLTLVSGRGAFGSNDYASVARSSDGRWVLVYLPTVREVSVDLGRVGAPVVARWFDPTSGRATPAGEGVITERSVRTLEPPGPNAAGDADWVLVLAQAERAD